MNATIIGTQNNPNSSGLDIAYRLSVPLQDCYPDWRNVMVRVRPNGERQILRCKGYQKADGSWSSIPGRDWIACFSPLTAHDLELVEREIK